MEKELSTMMKMFFELKEKHPDALLLFRCGDFYEAYEQDAVDAASVLGIPLKHRSHINCKDTSHGAITGFPHHALDIYLPKLVRAGMRVAICDQLEGPKEFVSLRKRSQ